MSNNKIRLNANKTDFIVIGTSRQRRKLTHFFPTNIFSHSIIPSDTVRNLYVTFDSDVNLIKLVLTDLSLLFLSYSSSSPYSSLYCSFRYQHHCYSTSRLDYCNPHLYNVASQDILKPQSVQNCLFRVVAWSPRFSHYSPLLKSPHWLPVQSRTIFKLCTNAYQTLSSGEPSYLFSMLFFSTQAQINPFIWFSLVVCSQG